MESGTTCGTYLETKRPIGEGFQLSKATSKAYCGTGGHGRAKIIRVLAGFAGAPNSRRVKFDNDFGTSHYWSGSSLSDSIPVWRYQGS